MDTWIVVRIGGSVNKMWEAHDLGAKEKRKNSNGYMEASYPEHPKAVDGKVLLHRLVMENHLKRFLNHAEVVHHVNEIKTCNEIWNLWLTNDVEHTLIHRMGKTHSAKTTATMSKKHKKIAGNRFRDPYSGKFAKRI